jgi:fucose permease
MRSASLGLACVASLAFVALGLPDGLLGVAWPSMRASFGLPLDALGSLLASFTCGYVGSSFTGGRLLARLGLGLLLVLSCLATGLSLLGYATTSSWHIVLVLAFVAGLGAGGIDTGINTYAAAHHGSRMLNWLHACYGIGAAGGPAIMTAVLDAQSPWQRGYAQVGVAQVALAATFAITLRARRAIRVSDARSAGAASPSIRSTLRLPVMRWSILLFFTYTGLELAVGAWTFTLLTEGRGISMITAGFSVSLFWAALTGGRVLGAALAGIVPVGVLIRGSLLMLAAGLAWLSAGFSFGLDLAGVLLAGAGAGPVFPTLIATTPARVGKAHAGNAVGCQIAAAAIGQSLVPLLLGVIGDRFGLEALGAGLVAVGIAVVVIHSAATRAGAPRATRPGRDSRAA